MDNTIILIGQSYHFLRFQGLCHLAKSNHHTCLIPSYSDNQNLLSTGKGTMECRLISGVRLEAQECEKPVQPFYYAWHCKYNLVITGF